FTIGFVLFAAIMAALELLGVNAAMIRALFVVFTLGTCLAIGIRTRTMEAAAFITTRRRMSLSYDAAASTSNGVAGLLLGALALGMPVDGQAFAAIATGWVAGLFLTAFLLAPYLC